MTSNNKKPDKFIRYPIASAWRRLGAKIIDILLIGIVIFGLGIAILATDPKFDWHEITEIQPWRYLLIGFINLILFFGLMFILPIFTGWTIGMKACKLKYIHILPFSKKALNLFKHEILIWGLMCILSFIVSIVLGCLTKAGYAKSLLLGIQTMGIGKVDEAASKPLYYVGAAFAGFYYASAIILLVVIIGLFIRNKKVTFYDKFSNIVVVHLAPTNELDKQHNKKKTINKKINYGIPGEISAGSFEEIDDLE